MALEPSLLPGSECLALHGAAVGLQAQSQVAGALSLLVPAVGSLPFPPLVLLGGDSARASQPGRSPKNESTFPSLPMDEYRRKPTFSVNQEEVLRPKSWQILESTFSFRKKVSFC